MLHPFLRARQFALCMTLRLFRRVVPRKVTGVRALYRVPELFLQAGVERVLLVTTPGFVRRGTLVGLLDECAAAGLAVTVFSDLTPDPTVAAVEAGVQAYRAGDCGGIAAVGGGSVMDCAKLIGARVACPDKPIRRMRGMMRVRRHLPFLVAVPTTAGTGSEVTAAAVVTDTVNGRHVKYAVSDLRLVPAAAVLDVDLTIPLSPQMTAETGMDALTHAVEAATNRFSSRYVREKAIASIRGIFHALPTATADGTHHAARTEMLEASYLAGLAFTNGFVGTVHALAHGVGALYGVPHGRANAVLLLPVLRAYGRAAEGKLAYLARRCGLARPEDSRATAAGAFLAEVKRLENALPIPATLPVREEDVKELVNRALREGRDYPTPRILGRKALEDILHAVMA